MAYNDWTWTLVKNGPDTGYNSVLGDVDEDESFFKKTLKILKK